MPQLRSSQNGLRVLRGRPQPCSLCKKRVASPKTAFHTSSRRGAPDPGDRGPFRTRLRTALRNTKIQWYTIPVSVGIGFLGGLQFYRTSQREKQRIEDEEDAEAERTGRPRRRPRVRPTGPLAVHISYWLPLKAMSRAWGWFNSIDIPYYFRVPGFKLYSWVFGVNLSEVEEQDLHTYPNLAAFFYRRLKPGVRPLDTRSHAILSPADGKVLQFGVIEHGEVGHVKGMTYSLEALLGSASPSFSGGPEHIDTEGFKVAQHQESESDDAVRADEEFANVNGISYTMTNVQTGNKPRKDEPAVKRQVLDASTKSKSSSEAEVRADFATSPSQQPAWWPFHQAQETALYYAVIYLAPGDYHRFHSPAPWIVERRRHFAGELYSVSPYLQRTLPGLFTLNERVALLGRWRYGFFSYTAVGATNVGSIVINFDSELRTNSLLTDTAADRAAEEAAKKGERYIGYAEATYKAASSILGGHALRKGEEMGGFQLGSSIVLVFEAPKGRRPSLDEGWDGKSLKGAWKWNITPNQKMKVGEALGWVEED